MLKRVVLVTGLIGLAWPASAQVNAGDVKWGPAPPVFPAGAQMAVLSGDPAKAGPIVVRLKLPAGYKIPAHQHPAAEYVTVLSGDLSLGNGDKLDAAKAARLNPGGFAVAAANANHFAFTNGGAVVQISMEGPFALTYADPNDDPTRR